MDLLVFMFIIVNLRKWFKFFIQNWKPKIEILVLVVVAVKLARANL